MKLQKLPSELTVEELLKALETSSKEEPTNTPINHSLPIIDSTNEISYSFPVASFLSAFNIKAGKNKVSGAILNTLYNLWNKENKLSRSEFNNQMNYFIKTDIEFKNKTLHRYYHVSENVVNLIKYIDHYRKTNKRKYRTNKNYKKYYEKFFKDIGIERGPLFIEADVLYHVYDTYMYKRNRKTYSYHNFELVCTLLFETKYFTGYTAPWFGVSENVKQHISIEAVSNWRKGRKLRGIKQKTIKEEDKEKIIYPEVFEQPEGKS